MKASEASEISRMARSFRDEAKTQDLIQNKFASCIETINKTAHEAKTYCEVAVRQVDEKDFQWLFSSLGYSVYKKNPVSVNQVNLWIIKWS